MSNLEQCEATHPERQSPLERWVNRERTSSGVVDSVAGLNEPIETLASGSRLLSDEEDGGPRLFSREELPDDRDVYHELEFLRKLKANEVGEEDELLGSGKPSPSLTTRRVAFSPNRRMPFSRWRFIRTVTRSSFMSAMWQPIRCTSCKEPTGSSPKGLPMSIRICWVTMWESRCLKWGFSPEKYRQRTGF